MAHVAADSSSSSMADQLDVNYGQEYRVKLGRSFTFPERNSFHTIKYDFKPQSVDSTKPGQLQVTDEEVNVSLPVQSQGDAVEEFTHFRGNKKPCTKECILIINTQTGEAILEKISNNVNLKAVRDGRKPAAVNRDRSVSPSPLMMQSKGHSVSKSQLSTSGGHRHLTPSPIPSATPTTSNNSTPSMVTAKGGGASSASSNATPGSSSKKGQKRQTKSKTPKTPAIITTSATQKQENKGRNGSKPKAKKKSEGSAKQASILTAPKIKTEPAMVAPQMSATSQAAAMSSMPLIGMGMELTREISPIHSNNPTPEPIQPPSRKKQKISPLTRSSSSSSSDSSDSDSEGEEPMSQAPPTQQAPVQFSSIPVTRVTSSQSHLSSMSSSGGNNMPVFSHSQPMAMTQKGRIAQKSHPGQLGQAKIPPPPNQRLSSGSSSGSDSDSSSGSSSSDSSSDSSDEENDKEVAAISRGPVASGQRAYQRSYSELKSDLQLSSDSGTSTD